MATRISINRAPVLTLWAAVVAERLGFDWEEALTLGRAVAGLNAQAKGRRLGIFKPAPAPAAKKRVPPPKPGATLVVELLGRAVPALRTPKGVRALGKEASPDSPEAVERYLSGKFGDSLPDARRAMSELAAAITPAALGAQAFALYEEFRPEVPAGQRGWGAKGVLDLDGIRKLARKRRG
jgi:hypothetical protein